ncbi:MAG: HD domain-containing phosphohydrolase [Alphaproteobacteria bacterium]|nr:HD domain-containing phosphohydrolase [Alphaproteobacteria bacterium]
MADITITDPISGTPGGAPDEKAGLAANGQKIIIGLALMAAVAVCITLVFRFVGQERERDMLAWQTRLGIVAASRAAAVDDWLARQFEEVQALAANPTLAVYLGQIEPGRDAGAAERGYLGNLLKVTAARTGFESRAKGPDVRANVQRIGVGGLMLLDMQGRLIVSTPNPPPNEGALRTFIGALSRGKAPAEPRMMLDIHRGPAGELVAGFAAPIYAVQSDPRPENRIGYVLGIKPLAAELHPLMKQPGAVEQSAEAILIRRAQDVIEYLTPLIDGAEPLARKLAVNTPSLAAAHALAHPGAFAQSRDYRGRDVLMTSVRIADSPWTLLYKVDRAEALGASEARLQRLLAIFLLVIALAAATIVAVWYKGASHRASVAADRFQDLANRFGQQRNFLRLLTDNQPSANAIIDANGVYRFANERAARRAGMSKDDMLGKTVHSVLGADVAKQYEKLNQGAIEHKRPAAALHRFEADGLVSYFQSKHVPMPAAEDLVDTVLLVEDDITDVMKERERRERTLYELVDTLVTVVDRRDPYAAHHSQRVAMVAEAIAEEMDLGEVLVETSEVAGKLLNIGKILVPTELLTKTGRLTEEEIAMVRDSIQTSAELIQRIEFDGPVYETLRQCQERWDGSGTPAGRREGDILVTARVVAVANAFVAMVSPRAHRDGVDLDAATEALLTEVGKAYDRRVVAALINFLENKGGRAQWAKLLAEDETRQDG